MLTQTEAIYRGLRLFVSPDSIVELRCLQVNGSENYAGWFQGTDDGLRAMAAQAVKYNNICRSVHFTPNPLSKTPNDAPLGEFKRRSTGQTADDSIIASRKWLLIDSDPFRISPEGEILDSSMPVTDSEHDAAYRVIESVRAVLEVSFGFSGAIVASSGNGWHLCYPIDLPNDELSKQMHKDFLKGLHKRYSTPEAEIDIKNYNASRIWKVYHTKARKGVEDGFRKHRLSGIVDLLAERDNADSHRQKNNERLKAVLARWAEQDKFELKDSQPVVISKDNPYVKKAIEGELEAIRSSAIGGRNDRLNVSSFAIGTLVGAGVYDRSEAESALLSTGLQIGLSESECRATIRSGLDAGIEKPRTIPEAWSKVNPAPVAAASATQKEEKKERKLPTSPSEVATIADLKAAGAKQRWLWEGWIQIGVPNLLAANGGVGKSRLVMDLARRIRHQLPWPDGQPMELPADSQILVMMSDNAHDELVTGAEKFGVEDTIRLNAHPDDPFGGTTFSEAMDYAEFEKRIELVKPCLVVIDTVGGSTDANLCVQEQAKQYFEPLQKIARRHSVAILCLSHLSAGGNVYGKRSSERVRTQIHMSAPDPEQVDRRRLWVEKSNSKKPPVLGVTMLDDRNEYDTNPPDSPENVDAGYSRPRKPKASPKQDACNDWLRDLLAVVPRKISDLISLGERHTMSFAPAQLYKAIDILEAQRYEEGGRKWVRGKDYVDPEFNIE